jgi:hypothetical protein
MSYVVHLWAGHEPSSLDQAMGLLETLTDSTTPPSAEVKARFAALVQQLIERFPAEVGGQDEAVSTWVEPAPPDLNLSFDGEVFSLAIYGEGISQLVPLLQSEAGKFGLTLLDEQGGTVHLPGGRSLDLHGLVAPRAAPPQPAGRSERLTERGIKARTRDLLAPQLEPLGFKFKEHSNWCSFSRDTPVGVQRIHVFRYPEGASKKSALVCEIDVALPDEVSKALAPLFPVPVYAHRVEDFEGLRLDENYLGLITHWAETPREFDDWLAQAERLIMQRYVPALDACRTPRALLDVDAGLLPGVTLYDSGVLLALAYLLGDVDLSACLAHQLSKSGHDPVRVRILNLEMGLLRGLPPDTPARWAEANAASTGQLKSQSP